MKVSELFEAAEYDNSTKKLSGTTKEWMAAIGATKEDVAKAYADAKDLPSYDALLDIVTDISSASQAKNGTFKFNRLEGVKGSYEIYANGQIRVTGMNDGAGWNAPEGTEIPYQTKLASPKPRLKHGDVNASLKMIYDRAFKEMTKKLLKIQKAAAKDKSK